MPRKKGVPRLTILIPVDQVSSAFETTLASVLRNRPGQTDVVVVTRQPYDDPYELADEVQFVTAFDASSQASLLNAGLVHVRAPILHVLASGVEVDEDWTEAAVDQIAQENVAAVSPLVVDAGRPEEIVAAGVGVTPAGNRQLCGEGKSVLDQKIAAQVVGPTLVAGFYRRDFLDLVGGWDVSFGEPLADLELALRIRALGWKVGLAHESLVRIPKQNVVRQTLFAESCQEARQRERLVRRYLSNIPTWRHWGATVLESIAALPSWRTIAQPLVRWMESRNQADRLESQRRLDEIAELLVHIPAEVIAPATLSLPTISTPRRKAA